MPVRRYTKTTPTRVLVAWLRRAASQKHLVVMSSKMARQVANLLEGKPRA